MKLNTTFSPLALALSTALGLLSPTAAHALLVMTAPVDFSGTLAVTDQEGGTSTSATNSPGFTVPIAQFNAATGVLTGTTLNLNLARTQTLTVAAVGSGDSNTQVTTSGSGTSTATFNAPGVTQTTTTVSAPSTSCKGQQKKGCSTTATPATATYSQALTSTDLNAWVGAGTTLATRSTTVTANQQTAVFPGAETTTYKLDWSGSLSASYTYLLHAEPSFNGVSSQLSLDLDFGTLFQNEFAPDFLFDIFNAAGVQFAGLDLDDIIGLGDVSALTTNLGLFSGLGQGNSNSYLASFDTSGLGTFGASYTLKFSDANVGASNTWMNRNDLTINMKGVVVAAPPNVVPEPGTLALLGIGVLGLAFFGRRKQRA